MSDHTMSVAEAAEYLGLKEHTIQTYVGDASDRLQAGPNGGVLVSSVERYERRRNTAISDHVRASYPRRPARRRKKQPEVRVVNTSMRDQVMRHTFILEGMIEAGAKPAKLRKQLHLMREELI